MPQTAIDLRNVSDEQSTQLPIGTTHYRSYVGPASQYDLMAASQFSLLTTLGLRDTQKVLDFGCGSLRLGRLLIPYLASGNYTGLDPNVWLIEDGLKRQLGVEIVRIKSPRFFAHDDFRADRCGENFDFIVAQSIFSHAGADLIATSLASFAAALAPSGLALVTVLHPGQDHVPEFFGSGWVYPGSVAHRPETLARIFAAANLPYFRALPWYHPRQTWYALAKDPARVPPPEYDRFLAGAMLNNPAWRGSTERG
jgi:SAM-dependent methyltransferase